MSPVVMASPPRSFRLLLVAERQEERNNNMRQSRHHVVSAAILAAALLLLAAVPAAMAQEETEHEEEFSYVRGEENGPERWGAIKQEWAACGTGRMQSPIDLSHERVSLVRSLGYLNHSYRAAEASIVNRGHDIKVKFDGDAGSVVINGTAYYLHQLHWHSPSEHTVDGRRYDMELHLVHQSAENKAAVIGLLYEAGGRADGFLRKLEPALKRIADRKDKEERLGVVDPAGARGRASVYYRYMGSLTTPPCTEGVIWTIVRRDMEKNARPIQDLNSRDISLFRPFPRKHY